MHSTPPKPLHLLDQALDLAVKIHSGQVDRGGRPYLLHVLQVVDACRDDPDTAVVAALHDVVEDSDLTFEDLVGCGFPERIVVAVDALTRRTGEPYGDAIERAAADPIARRVKIADLESNMDVRRLSGLGPDDLRRLDRYAQAWKRLRAEA